MGQCCNRMRGLRWSSLLLSFQKVWAGVLDQSCAQLIVKLPPACSYSFVIGLRLPIGKLLGVRALAQQASYKQAHEEALFSISNACWTTSACMRGFESNRQFQWL